uniref:Uncharacterized protein n=1 Tax=Opuntia streptacantha TaxID=393608 RepID=A0A7C9EAJ7_OPUST
MTSNTLYSIDYKHNRECPLKIQAKQYIERTIQYNRAATQKQNSHDQASRYTEATNENIQSSLSCASETGEWPKWKSSELLALVRAQCNSNYISPSLDVLIRHRYDG